MRGHAIRLAALGLICLNLTWVWGTQSPGWDAEETEASLFDDETVVKTGSNVERTATSLDVEATVDSWTRPRQVANGDETSKALADGLVVLTTVAFQTPPPQSVGGNSGTSNSPSCSIGANTQPATNACSTNTNPGDPPTVTGGTCSTGTSTKPCSAYTDGDSPVPVGSNNTTCSALPGPGGNPKCSAGGTVSGSKVCSTAGGQSGQESDGATACSAAGDANGQKCSTFATNTKCSTNTGQHQSCSAGAAGTGTSAQCSASNGGTCSVSKPSSGTFGNQCSAINNPPFPDSGGTTTCSTTGNTGGTCSVSASNTNNAQCTTFGSFQGTGKCSVSGATTNSSCSVLNADGSFKSGPVGNPPKCGNGYTGHP